MTNQPTSASNVSKSIVIARWIVLSILGGMVFAAVVVMVDMKRKDLIQARRYSYKISCHRNLREIGLALSMYSADWDDHLPPFNGAASLELLRAQGYLKDHKMYICPATGTTGKDGDELTEATVDYVYKGGLTESSSSNSPLVWDKPGNHENYGNVLYVDRHTTGFAGKEWMKDAGLK